MGRWRTVNRGERAPNYTETVHTTAERDAAHMLPVAYAMGPHMRGPVPRRAARERLGQTHSEPNAPQRPSPACVISGPTVSRVQSSRTEAASCSAGGRAARRLRAADARWRQGWAESGGGGGGDEQGRALRWCSRRRCLDAQKDADVGLVLAVPDIVEKDRDCACGRRRALQPAEREGTRLGGAPA